MEQELINYLEVKIRARRKNESLARSIVGAFCVEANPSIEIIEDIKTVVSEAITNCIVHAYPDENGIVDIVLFLYKEEVKIVIRDYGMGIVDIEKAMTPFYSSKESEERSGMGFTIMESFMDSIEVINMDKGVQLTLIKKFWG